MSGVTERVSFVYLLRVWACVCLYKGPREQSQLSHLYLLLPFRLLRNYTRISLTLFFFPYTGLCHCFLNIGLVPSLVEDILKMDTLQYHYCVHSTLHFELRESYFKMLMSTSIIVDKPKAHTKF